MFGLAAADLWFLAIAGVILTAILSFLRYVAKTPSCHVCGNWLSRVVVVPASGTMPEGAAWYCGNCQPAVYYRDHGGKTPSRIDPRAKHTPAPHDNWGSAGPEF